MGIGVCIIMMSKGEERTSTCVISLACIVIIISYFYIVLNNNVIFYENPVVPLIGIMISFGVVIYVLPKTCYNCYLVCIGSTMKQQSYFNNLNKQNPQKFSILRGCISLVYFLVKSLPKSELTM